MIRALTRRSRNNAHPDRATVSRDPSARFAYDLATKPPTKDVASVKAASDLFEASLRPVNEHKPAPSSDEEVTTRKRYDD